MNNINELPILEMSPLMVFHIAYWLEFFVAEVALVWPFTSVSPQMNCQVSFLAKCLPTFLKGASKGMVSYVRGLNMVLQSRFSWECFSTRFEGTWKIKVWEMSNLVIFKMLAKFVTLITSLNIAFVTSQRQLIKNKKIWHYVFTWVLRCDLRLLQSLKSLPHSKKGQDKSPWWNLYLIRINS